MKRTHPALLLPWLLLASVNALAQTSTQMMVADTTASYSDAVDITATLQDASGTPVADAAVVFYMQDAGNTFNIDLGQVITGPGGQATVRVPLVNGCALLAGNTLAAGSTAIPADYTVEASFGGDTISGIPYVGSTGAGTLHLVRETADVRIVLGTSGTVGETLTVGAQVVDVNGDAPCDRSALTGPGPVTVAGRTLAFFWDVTLDGDYSDPRENLGTAMTTRPSPELEATATVDVDLVPVNNQPRAGTWDNQLQVQLPSTDTLYLPATARGRLVLFPAPVDAMRTTMVADPETARAGSAAPITVTITLRDRFDNALGVDADLHTVALSFEGNSHGAALETGQAQQDPTNGTYKQVVRGATTKGTVTVQVSVDGQAGGTLDMTFTGLFPFGPCMCATVPGHKPIALLFAALCLVGVHKRRRR